MLTSIGRVSAQRAFARSSAVAARRTTILPIRSRIAIIAASRTFTVSSWDQLATKAAASTKAKAVGTKKTSTRTKKPATGTKKAASTKTKVVKKKKKALKPKPKPKPKRVPKVLTPEEKRKADIRRLKPIALLKEPKMLPASTWQIFLSDAVKSGAQDIIARTKDLSEEFKNLSDYQMKELRERAERNKLENNASYKAWVEKHTPLEIYNANVARKQLRAKLIKKSGVAYRLAIRDERLPKHPPSAYTLFCKGRWGEGDLSGVVTESVTKIAAEWKALDSAQRKPYEDLAAADRDRYEKEMMNVLGKTVKRSSSPDSVASDD